MLARMRPPLSRRRLLAAALAAPLTHCTSSWQAPELGPIAAALPGDREDSGPSGLTSRGLARIERDLNIRVRYVERIPADRDAALDALRGLARSDAKLIVAYGEPMSDAVQRVAWEFPQQRFAVLEGNEAKMRPNVGVYTLLAEQSAWLAGALAGLLAQRGAAGYVGAGRTPARLKRRAAFAAGLTATNAGAKLLGDFTGTDDNAEAARKLTGTIAEAGADQLFLDVGASTVAALDACRERRIRPIGAERDWVAAMPEAFVASAVADPGPMAFAAARDLVDAVLRGDLVRRFGLRQSEFVRLALAADIAPSVRARIADLREQVMVGRIPMPI